MKRRLNRMLTASLALAMAVSMCACGGKTDVTDESNETQNTVEKVVTSYDTAEYLYVPEYLSLAENANFYRSKIIGDTIYYPNYEWDEITGVGSVTLVAVNIADKSTATVPLDLGTEELNDFDFDAEGNMYYISTIYDFDEVTYESNMQYFYAKVDKAGTTVFHNDITADLKKESVEYVQKLVCDDKGRCYISSDNKVCLLNADGTYVGTVNFDGAAPDWIEAICRGTDGNVYVSFSNYDTNAMKRYFLPIDFDKKTTGANVEFPVSMGNAKIFTGSDGFYYISDGSTLSKYNAATGEKEQLLTWSDSDIVGDYIENFTVRENGDVLALVSDWESGSNDAIILKKTEASKVQKKINLTLLSVFEDSSTTRRCIEFNKQSDKYHISVVSFVDLNGEWTDTTYQDGINAFNNYLTSGKGADIISLEYGDVPALAEKGIYADLSEFLANSTQLSKEDYLPNILANYTYNDKLIAIPRTFNIEMIVGDGAELGDRTGWTIDEMMAYCDKHPGADAFEYASKTSMLYTMLSYSKDAFIDARTGKANFNSDEFKKVLQFANRFMNEEELDNKDFSVSAPTLIQRGELLFDQVYLSSFQDIQMYYEIFKGNPAFIGYPTADGTPGISISLSEAYAISAKSENPEGAWQFLESMLLTEQGQWDWGFSTNKKFLEKQKEQATKVEYVLDENGDPYLDEDGNPVVSGGGGGFSYQDGWSFTYHVTTEEEADKVIELLGLATTTVQTDEEIFKIINEEAQAYFSGQKSVDEVADVIQRRVQLYLDEKM